MLLDATTLWMAELPAAVRPIALAAKFPRIANSIAELWRRGARCEEYLDHAGRRPARQPVGVPARVAQELTALRSYYAEFVRAIARLGSRRTRLAHWTCGNNPRPSSVLRRGL